MSILALQNKIDKPDIKKSTFDLSHTNTLTGKFGELRPVACMEVLPNDEWTIDINHIIRCLPLAGPIASRVDLYVHAFFVSNQNIWDEWTDFIRGETAVMPTQNLNNVTLVDDTIGACYGLPSRAYTANDFFVSDLPHRGYWKIYNDFYRNKVITDPIDHSTKSYASKLHHRNWRKDYFTSAVPTPQLGDPATISADIVYLTSSKLYNLTTNPPATHTNLRTATLTGDGGVYMKEDTNLELMRLENLSSVSIEPNDIRYAHALQSWLTSMLTAGDEYKDHLLYIFGVNSSDARHRMAEYIGGYTKPIIINDVTLTAETREFDSNDLVNPAGTQAGQGMSFGRTDNRLYFKAEEHGYIHVLISIIPKSSYHGGCPKHLRKFTVTDFAFPHFAYLPEQEIKRSEIYITQSSTDEEAFGYIERYAEYKHHNDVISGQMDDEYKHLHFAEIAETSLDAVLNDTFLKCVPREDAFAVQGDIHYFGQIGFNIDCKRVLPFNVDGVQIL